MDITILIVLLLSALLGGLGLIFIVTALLYYLLYHKEMRQIKHEKEQTEDIF